jgi:hypothetical protein
MLAGDTPETKAKKKKAAFEKILKGATRYQGLLNLVKKDGQLYADLSEKHLGMRLLVFPGISRGISQGRLLGSMQLGPDDVVLSMRKKQDRVFLVRENLRFQADKDSPGAKVVTTSYSDSIIRELKVAGELVKEKRLLVRLDPAFVADWVGIGDSLKENTAIPYRLDSGRSHLAGVKVFPKNVELEVALTFTGGTAHALDTVPDGRSLSLALHYSILKLPETKFRPRKADDRVGHFLTALKKIDSASPDGPFVRYVNRWYLERAHPEAKRSTVKKPLVFFLSKTIPYQYRPTVREAILTWNKAFERIGLLDAIEVRVQGQEEDWDPADVRYHTVSFTSDASFNGIGPSRAHPLTGQMLDADILYNASAMHNMLRSYPPLGIRKPGAEEALLPSQNGCDFQRAMRGEMELAALHWMTQHQSASESPVTSGTTDPKAPLLPQEFLLAALKKTIIHEVGHVLGLRHNFKGSSVIPLKRLNDVEYTREHGLTGSIMDYPAVNLAPSGIPQGEYFSSTLGAYDYWAIEYAYAPFEKEKEEASLAKIAARSVEPALAYGSDEDRWTGYLRNLDPLCQVYDLSDDPLAFARQRNKIIKGLWKELPKTFLRQGDRYARLRYAVLVLLFKLRSGANTALPYLGGQFHHRDHRSPSGRPAFVPVPAAKQREALHFLLTGIFSDQSYVLPEGLLNLLGPDHFLHWGSRSLGSRLDFPFYKVLSNYQQSILSRLTSPELLQRILDGERQLPSEADRLDAAELLQTLSDSFFQELKDGHTISTMRRNLQRLYLSRLAALTLQLPSEAPTDASALARLQLKHLEMRLEKATRAETSLPPLARAHLQDLRARIGQTLGAERVR